MPRIIQPGGSGGKMRVRYTTRRKHGLIATSKRMMVEGMTLRAAASELVFPPSAEKLIQNSLEKRSRHAIPRPFHPKPRLTLINCHDVCTGKWADCLI